MELVWANLGREIMVALTADVNPTWRHKDEEENHFPLFNLARRPTDI